MPEMLQRTLSPHLPESAVYRSGSASSSAVISVSVSFSLVSSVGSSSADVSSSGGIAASFFGVSSAGDVSAGVVSGRSLTGGITASSTAGSSSAQAMADGLTGSTPNSRMADKSKQMNRFVIVESSCFLWCGVCLLCYRNAPYEILWRQFPT